MPTALLTACLAVLPLVLLPPSESGAALRSGAFFAFQSPERWFALTGAGLCLAGEPLAILWLATASLLGGASLGLVLPHTAFWSWIARADIFPAHHFLGPAACLLVGLTLLARGRWQTTLLVPAVFIMTGSLSLTAALNDPTPRSGAFVTGTALSAIAVLAAAVVLRRLVSGRWTVIGERIAGSWLLTIGLLLAALRLAPAPPVAIELAPPATAPVWSAPDVPGYTPPTRRDGNPFSGATNRSGLPMGTN